MIVRPVCFWNPFTSIPNWICGLNPNIGNFQKSGKSTPRRHFILFITKSLTDRRESADSARNGSSTLQAYYSACSVAVLRVRRYSSSRWQVLFRQRSSGSCYSQAFDRMYRQDILLSTYEWDMRSKTMCTRRIPLVSYRTVAFTSR